MRYLNAVYIVLSVVISMQVANTYDDELEQSLCSGEPVEPVSTCSVCGTNLSVCQPEANRTTTSTRPAHNGLTLIDTIQGYALYRIHFVKVPDPLHAAVVRTTAIIDRQNLHTTRTVELAPDAFNKPNLLKETNYPLHTPESKPVVGPLPIVVLPSLDSVLELSNGIYKKKIVVRKPLTCPHILYQCL